MIEPCGLRREMRRKPRIGARVASVPLGAIPIQATAPGLKAHRNIEKIIESRMKPASPLSKSGWDRQIVGTRHYPRQAEMLRAR